MLVCSEGCVEAEKCLLAAGCWVVKVRDGRAAVSLAERESFDGAVVVSTGKEMDLAETVFNLRDINRSMQIIIVTDQGGVDRSVVAEEIIARATPRTQLLTMTELVSYVGSADAEESVAIKKGG